MRWLITVLTLALATSSQAIEREKSPRLQGGAAVILASLIDGLKLRANGSHATELKCIIDANQKACAKAKPVAFTVTVDRIACSESDVAIGSFACDIEKTNPAGQKQTAHSAGHPAFELMAALRQASIESEGTAGHLEIGATSVSCTLDLAMLLEKVGGGARCELVAASGAAQ